MESRIHISLGNQGSLLGGGKETAAREEWTQGTGRMGRLRRAMGPSVGEPAKRTGRGHLLPGH